MSGNFEVMPVGTRKYVSEAISTFTKLAKCLSELEEDALGLADYNLCTRDAMLMEIKASVDEARRLGF